MPLLSPFIEILPNPGVIEELNFFREGFAYEKFEWLPSGSGFLSPWRAGD